MEDNTLEFMDTRGHNFYKENLESQIAELTKERDELKGNYEKVTAEWNDVIVKQSQEISDLKAQVDGITKYAEDYKALNEYKKLWISKLEKEVERLREGITRTKLKISKLSNSYLTSNKLEMIRDLNLLLNQGSKDG